MNVIFFRAKNEIIIFSKLGNNAQEKGTECFLLDPFIAVLVHFLAAKSVTVMEPAHNHHFVNV